MLFISDKSQGFWQANSRKSKSNNSLNTLSLNRAYDLSKLDPIVLSKKNEGYNKV